MISVFSKPKYTSKNHKLVVYETTVQVETEDTMQLMAEFEAALKTVLGSTQFTLDEALKIAKILDEADKILSVNVQSMMGGE